MTEEAKTTILHLRESLVQQKETILDQRETIRELTAKLTLCEGFGRGMGGHDDHHYGPHLTHHPAPHHPYPDSSHPQAHHSNHISDPHYPLTGHRSDPHHRKAALGGGDNSSPEQLGRMLQALKERLENLQSRNTSSSYSNSLRDLLQRHDNEADAHGHGHPPRMAYHSQGHRGAAHGIPPSKLDAVLSHLHHRNSDSGQANELVLIEWGNNPMELLVNDQAVTLPLSLSDGKWHHVCVTWSTRDGLWEAYQDGVKRGSGENLSAWHPIKPGGVFILGQEQLVFPVIFAKLMSDLQMWSHVLTSHEIYNLASCGNHMTGDVIAWTESVVELHGGVTKYPFDPCH
ncbi:hypothetical protein AAFF_G00070150 [Aldrovandia affinis]|uniref:Pentraxin (PTX) domain-containing protein n=1 Tax=Aldrovandia affinis TaxID=143900 RepID=A0AAD7S193_9TELE|nr:hypothetical protein AAFF_G00070150 [Aldrovandia affinis]